MGSRRRSCDTLLPGTLAGGVELKEKHCRLNCMYVLAPSVPTLAALPRNELGAFSTLGPDPRRLLFVFIHSKT